MPKSRAEKSFMNIGVMGLYEVVVTICGLITPRLILTAFGSTYNGITSSITQFLSFIAILRAGVAGASRVSLYNSLAQKDILATSRILKATERYLRNVAYVFLGYLVILALFYKSISRTEVSWIECASLVIIIGLGTFAQYYFGLTYQTLLASDQKSYIYYAQQIVVTILNTMIAVVLIKLGCSIQIVKLGSAVIFVASPILLNLYVSKKYSIIKKCDPDEQALNQRRDVLGLAIANIVHDNTDIAVLTIFTDVKIVSVYTVYNLVINGLKKVISVFTTGLEAAFENMWAKGEEKAIERNMNIFELFIFSFVSVVFSCTIILILPFVRLYTHGVTDVEYIIPTYAFVAVIAQAFYCMQYLTLVQAAGHYKQTRNGSFMEAGINLTFSILLIQKIGIVGVAIGTLVADIFRTVQYAKYCCDNLLKRNYWKIFNRLLWALLNIVIVVTVYNLTAGEVVEINSWMGWLIVAVIMGLVACVTTFSTAMIFYKNDVINAIDIVKRVFKKKQTN